jgi:phosphoglycolate phosphatase
LIVRDKDESGRLPAATKDESGRLPAATKDESGRLPAATKDESRRHRPRPRTKADVYRSRPRTKADVYRPRPSIGNAVRLIVFDCDGTLVDSQHLIVEAMGAAFAANGLPVPSRQHVLRHVGLSVAEAMTAMTESANEALILKLSASYRTAFASLRQKPSFAEPLFPGARAALDSLGREEAVLLGIATGKSRRGVDHLLAREGLADRFVTIQTADDAPSKPHPGMLLRAMSEASAAPEETIMIGDSSYDMLMARNAGAVAIGVAWGYHPAPELIEAGARAVAEDFPQLLSLLSASQIGAAA